MYLVFFLVLANNLTEQDKVSELVILGLKLYFLHS